METVQECFPRWYAPSPGLHRVASGRALCCAASDQLEGGKNLEGKVVAVRLSSCFAVIWGAMCCGKQDMVGTTLIAFPSAIWEPDRDQLADSPEFQNWSTRAACLMVKKDDRKKR